MTLIVAEKVGKLLNEWYTAIKKRDKDSSISLKKQITNKITNMEQNQNILLYYTLLDFRHSLLIDHEKSENLYQELQSQEQFYKIDNMIRYYFYFFAGQYEFHKKNYVQAITYYQIAETQIKAIPDEIEHAEFNIFVAFAYYTLGHNLISLNYAEKAYCSFKSNQNYVERSINSEMLIGSNLFDLQHFDKAISHYTNTIEMASKHKEKLKHVLWCGNFNIGLCYQRKKDFRQATIYFKRALWRIEQKSSYQVFAIYQLTYTLYLDNQIKQAQDLYTRGINLAESLKNEEYLNRFKLIYHLFDEYNIEKVYSSFEKVSYRANKPELRELSLHIANALEEKGKWKESNIFFKKYVQVHKEILKNLQ